MLCESAPMGPVPIAMYHYVVICKNPKCSSVTSFSWCQITCPETVEIEASRLTWLLCVHFVASLLDPEVRLATWFTPSVNFNKNLLNTCECKRKSKRPPGITESYFVEKQTVYSNRGGSTGHTHATTENPPKSTRGIKLNVQRLQGNSIRSDN